MEDFTTYQDEIQRIEEDIASLSGDGAYEDSNFEKVYATSWADEENPDSYLGALGIATSSVAEEVKRKLSGERYEHNPNAVPVQDGITRNLCLNFDLDSDFDRESFDKMVSNLYRADENWRKVESAEDQMNSSLKLKAEGKIFMPTANRLTGFSQMYDMRDEDGEFFHLRFYEKDDRNVVMMGYNPPVWDNEEMALEEGKRIAEYLDNL